MKSNGDGPLKELEQWVPETGENSLIHDLNAGKKLKKIY